MGPGVRMRGDIRERIAGEHARRITVIGTGYVGLTTGATLAQLGHDVTCLDVEEVKIERLRRGDLPLYEPGLDGVVSRNVAANRLHFTCDYGEALASAFLATRFSFINEVVRICDRVGADVQQVAAGMGYDPRIGPSFLEAAS